jgi:hypothetical protein
MVLTTECEAAPQDTSCMHHWFKPPKQTEVVSRVRYNHPALIHVPAIPNAVLWTPLAIAEFAKEGKTRVRMGDI